MTKPAQQQDKNFLQKFWDKIEHVWKTLKHRINKIKDIFYGKVKRLGKSLLDGLDKIKDSFKEGIEMIGKEFNSVSEKFQELIVEMIDRMLGFLSRFRIIVEQKGYAVSTIEITVPAITFEFKTIFGLIPIPLPKMDPPGLTVTIEPPK